MGRDFRKAATWELQAMVKARSFLRALNTPEEEAELKAIKKELASRRAMERNRKKKNMKTETIINSLCDALNEHLDTRISMLKEDVTSFPNASNEMELYDEAIKRLEAAKRGLSIANRLRDPEEQKRHRSRIFSNLNRIRNIVNQLQRETDSSFANKHEMMMHKRRNNIM